MRSGRRPGGEKIGGAWDWVAMTRSEGSRLCDSDTGVTTNATKEKDNPCTEEGCTKEV
jgi:hypothetical protein